MNERRKPRKKPRKKRLDSLNVIRPKYVSFALSFFFLFFVFAETVAIGRQQKKQKGRTREKWPKSTRQVVLIPTPTDSHPHTHTNQLEYSFGRQNKIRSVKSTSTSLPTCPSLHPLSPVLSPNSATGSKTVNPPSISSLNPIPPSPA